MHHFEVGEAYAHELDQQDPLASFRGKFNIPKTNSGKDELYFCGNSLGLQPKLAQEYVQQELEKWATLGVRGHFDCEFPWMPYHEFLTEESAKLVGANNSEVVVMNSLTANLHFMMATFYKPNGKRTKILIEDHAFPSDHYAVESQIKHHGLDPKEHLILLKPRRGEEILHTEDLIEIIENQGEEVALILLPGVQYYTGQVLDMKTITEIGHKHGITVGFDLAHAVGNIPLDLHEWQVDFACWCSYKYLNSGPGSVAGCFIHQTHCENTELNRFSGWWGHDKSTRFKMGNEFHPIPTAEGWQLSNPPILSLAAIRASLDTFKAAGGIHKLREKSLKLTAYLRYLLNEEVAEYIEIITPNEVEFQGCQLSLICNAKHLSGRELFERLESNGITTDWREPNVIRVAPVPLYNSFYDVYRFVEELKAACNA